MKAKKLTRHASVQKKLDKTFNGEVVLKPSGRWINDDKRLRWTKVYLGEQLVYTGNTIRDVEQFVSGLILGTLIERHDQ